MSINNKQQVFIREYTRDFNASRAALVAGYSPKTAYSYGQQLLKNLEIQAAIKARIEEITMGSDEVLIRLGDMARGDMADLMEITPSGFIAKLLDAEGNVNPKTKLIKKIKQKVTTYLSKTEDGEDREVIETEFELYDAQAALALLGKYHALFVDRTEITGKDGGLIRVTLKGEDD